MWGGTRANECVCVGGGDVEGLRWLGIECRAEGVDLVPIERRSLGEVLVVVVVWGGGWGE